MLKELIAHLHALGEVDTERGGDPGGRYPSEVVSVPAGRTLVDLERFQAAPNRIKHKATLVSTTAFIGYLNRFKGPETSVYIDLFGEHPSLTAVIDHHGKNAPTWGGHVARFAPKFSMEWEAWKGLHEGGAFTQAQLVEFMEDHANDLKVPTPAKMLTAVSKFETVENHVYQSSMNLDNGDVELTYVKGGGQKKVAFPHALTLAIPVFENEAVREFEGRLRYRTANGAIAFLFAFKNDPERVERDALRQLAEHVAEHVEDAQFYEGTVGG